MRFVSREAWGARAPRGVQKVAASKRQNMMAHYTTGEELGKSAADIVRKMWKQRL